MSMPGSQASVVPSTQPREALQALRIAEACEISRQERRPVSPAEIPDR
ncbi:MULTISPECIES: hypothetical protein [unclassified Streptomyces]|nr:MULTISPECIES: hypothetical protein [unclassified Streptomyces]MCH0560957.1 hypothetical protein [Streptomyces sp. MUM 16J]